MASKRLAVGTIAVVAIVAAAYTGSAWFFGKQIEAVHAQADIRIAAVPYLKLVQHSYDRGLLGANEEITFELAPALFQLPPSADVRQGEAAAASLPPIRVTVKSTITHGPFPGFSSLAAGRARTTVVFDDAIQKKLDSVFAGKPAVTIDTLYQLAGGGSAQLSSPPFKTEVTSDKTGKQALLSGDGVEVTVNFNREFEQYDVQGSAPRFAVSEPGGVELVFAGLGLEARQKRIFADEPNLYAGTAAFKLAAIDVVPGKESDVNAPTFGVKNLLYSVDVPLNGDYVDLIGKIGAGEVKVGDRDYGPVHYDFSLKHLNARKLANLNRKMMGVYASPENLQDPARIAGVFSALKEPLLELLVDNPRFNIERLSFHTADGDAAMSATLGLTGATLTDFSSPLVLLPKIDLTADLAFPATLPAAMQSAPGVDEDEATARREMVEQSIDAFVQQGYATRADGMIRTKAVFNGKELLINGRPFNPLSMALSQP